jgi:hypothetical protein
MDEFAIQVLKTDCRFAGNKLHCNIRSAVDCITLDQLCLTFQDSPDAAAHALRRLCAERHIAGDTILGADTLKELRAAFGELERKTLDAAVQQMVAAQKIALVLALRELIDTMGGEDFEGAFGILKSDL